MIARLARANAHGLREVGYEYLAVTDGPRCGGCDDGLDGLFNEGVGYCSLDLRLGHEVDRVFGTAVELGVAFLPAETLDLGNRQSLNAGFAEGLPSIQSPRSTV